MLGQEEIKSNVIVEDKVLTMQRDTKDLLEMQYLSLMDYKAKEKDEILSDISKVTDVGISSWTHEAQRFNLDKAIRAQKIENDVLKSALDDKDIKSIMLDIMLFSKYILVYRKPPYNHEQELYYISQFKEKIRNLFSKVKDIQALIKAVTDVGGLFRVITLAYAEIAEQDKLLQEFRASELVGHNVAYQVAKNENKFEHLKITNETGRVLEEYDIREIKVMRDGKRNRGLKGIILISKTIQEEVLPTLYISWAGTHGSESLNADLERTPGEESFRQSEDQILKQVIAAIQEIGKPVKIMICGHSLGGALSQLLFHSLQRILAFHIQNEEVQEKVQKLELKFNHTLQQLSPHQRDLSDIKIDMNLIADMRVDVWNSAGVLSPVIDYSNELAAILVKAGIPQHATFGFVNGDVLQSIGHGSILNKVLENGVKIKVLEVESSTTRTFMAALGAVVAFPAGLGLVGSNPIGWLAGAFCMSAMFGEIFNNTSAAHRKHHFKTSVRPGQGYSIFTSHKEDGSLNTDECKQIQAHLTNKSTSILDTGIHLLSHAYMQEERFKSEFTNAVAFDKKNGQDEKTLKFIIAHIKAMSSVEEARIIKLLSNKELENILTIQDESGKNLLHYAVENANYALALELLMHEPEMTNQLDQEGNYPLLTFMQKVNTCLYQSVETYNIGILLLAMTHLDLSLKNKADQSVEKIYRSWYWSGYNARAFMTELAKRISLVAPATSVASEAIAPSETSTAVDASANVAAIAITDPPLENIIEQEKSSLNFKAS